MIKKELLTEAKANGRANRKRSAVAAKKRQFFVSKKNVNEIDIRKKRGGICMYTCPVNDESVQTHYIACRFLMPHSMLEH